MTDPIIIPITHPGAITGIEITPDIARQIVQMGVQVLHASNPLAECYCPVCRPMPAAKKPAPIAADKLAPAPATGPACFMCGEPRGAHQPGKDGRLKCPPAEQPAADKPAPQSLVFPATGETAAPVKGDYVLATKYEDGEAWDWWGLGWLDSIDNGRFMVVDSEGKQTRGNGYRRCRKISRECGNWLWAQREELERTGAKLWDLVASFGNKPADQPAGDDAEEVGQIIDRICCGNERAGDATRLEGIVADLRAKLNDAADKALANAEKYDQRCDDVIDLRDKLAATKTCYEAQIEKQQEDAAHWKQEYDGAMAANGRLAAERDRLAARVAELEREASNDSRLQHTQVLAGERDKALAELAQTKDYLAEANAMNEAVEAERDENANRIEIWKEQCQSAEAAHRRSLADLAAMTERAERNEAIANTAAAAIELANKEGDQWKERAEKAERELTAARILRPTPAPAIVSSEQGNYIHNLESERDAARAEADAWKEIAKANGWVMK